MRSGGHGPTGQARYACAGPAQCIRRHAAPVDDFVRRVIVDVLRRDGVKLLRRDDRPDVSAERARLSALRATARELPGLVGAGVMSVSEFKVAKDRNEAEIAKLAAVVDRVTGPTPLVGIADAEDAGAAFLAADVDRQRAVIAELAVVTVLPVGRGRRPFDPTTVKIEPHGSASLPA
jgi:site-specific DNA recombinase